MMQRIAAVAYGSRCVKYEGNFAKKVVKRLTILLLVEVLFEAHVTTNVNEFSPAHFQLT